MSTIKKYAKQAFPYAMIAVLSGTYYYWQIEASSSPSAGLPSAGLDAPQRPERLPNSVPPLRQVPVDSIRNLPAQLSGQSPAPTEMVTGDYAVKTASGEFSGATDPLDLALDDFELTIAPLSLESSAQESVSPGVSSPGVPGPSENDSPSAATSSPRDSESVRIGSHQGRLISNPYLTGAGQRHTGEVRIEAPIVDTNVVESNVVESNVVESRDPAADRESQSGFPNVERGQAPSFPTLPTADSSRQRSFSEQDFKQQVLATQSAYGTMGMGSVLETEMEPAAGMVSRSGATSQNLATPAVLANAQNSVTRPARPIPLPGPVYSQIIHHLDYGNSLARRSATLLAKQEFTKGLSIVAESSDNQLDTQAHLSALHEGFTALREAADFDNAQAGGELDPLRVAEPHDTPIIRLGHFRPNTPSQARKAYMLFAQDRIVQAVNKQTVSADLLYALGKTHLVEAMYGSQSQRLDYARAAILFQCALMVNPQHVRSANELGVILARSGRLSDAKVLFQNAVSTEQSFAEGWRNLAKVHQELGEEQFAQLASHEAEMVDGIQQQPVKVVNSEQFNNSFGAWGTPENPGQGQVVAGPGGGVNPAVGQQAADATNNPPRRFQWFLPKTQNDTRDLSEAANTAAPETGGFRKFGGF